MRVIEPYIQYIENLTLKLSYAWGSPDDRVAVESALNGELSKTLRNLVSDQDLKEAGAFFTSETMADKLVNCIALNTSKTFSVLDSACGGGNLLLAVARQLPVELNLKDTLLVWGGYLKGIDLHTEFVRATRSRLILLAALRGTEQYGQSFLACESLDWSLIFPSIFTSNSLEIQWPKADFYLLNPPFNLVPVPDWCKWASGRVCQAALFVIKSLKEAEEGSIIRTILPDVLRSGSRYKKWRSQVEKLAIIENIEILGQFDEKTHVDVFVLTLKIGLPTNNPCPNWLLAEGKPTYLHTIGTYCDVKVGRVVPHRDFEEGPKYPYLDVNHLPQWATIHPGEIHRQYKGTTFETPFVAVRRNSRSNDPHRAVGTLIKSKPNKIKSKIINCEKVAVENHLIVVKPKPGSIIDCEKILKILRDSRTSNWLNERIRCRHLTVDSIKTIPWWNYE